MVRAVAVLGAMPPEPQRNFPCRIGNGGADSGAALVAFELRRLTGHIERGNRRIGRVKNSGGDRTDARLVVAITPGETFEPINVELGAKLQGRDCSLRCNRP